MADELPQEAQANLIDQIASNRMGVEPQQQAPAKEEEPKETAEEKAVEEGSPDTEGDKMDMDAILYEIDFGDGDMRKLNPNQIRETFNRYRELNFKNAQNANLNKVVEAAIKNGFAKNPDDAARQILNMMKAAQSNPQMGDEDGKTNVQASQEQVRDALSQWEEDNAVALPPGFRETQEQMANMATNMNKLQAMLGQVLQQGQNAADQGAQQAVEAQAMKGDAMRQMIANNLDKGAAKVGLTDQDAEDFQVFFMERGYTQDDFIDPGLTLRVMNDFKNEAQSGEMERLRDISKRRQAFTGSVSMTPQTGESAASTPADNDPTLGRLTERAMNRG